MHEQKGQFWRALGGQFWRAAKGTLLSPTRGSWAIAPSLFNIHAERSA